MAYLSLRKEGKIGRAWIEGSIVLLVPANAPTDLQAAAESMSKEKFAGIVNSLLDIPILAPPISSIRRKPVSSATSLLPLNFRKIG